MAMLEQTGDGPAGIPVVSVVGKSNAGKTTLLEKLVSEAKRRNWRVAAVKHDVHGFEMDRPGKDTWRFAQAGADTVVISSPKKIAILEAVREEQDLDAVIALIRGVDLIFTEGYKHGKKPKIEVFRAAAHRELLCAPEELIAIATDTAFDTGVPCYGLDDAAGLCDLIAAKFGVRGSAS
ncbi:P-loop containing nucleoside triphosphate hydrolase [Acididesulfobacillus acetoxydans]|uniref:Molybdopterin-guanine dinucleotide biosynthesis protein MobB n=2 Tax=Acididesulfobacillus acetoxydans TaxID=1561005 RepID=A0A8S0X706_9FIRM|nr:P-loop containing nucleoside triphosphate hydrolase [Acididesulfobacillus acetoxydans]CEJ05812.1 Molybdopterin-guanine dinucleotide biosynthesis protein MobB [Acididesulfobacillus acetoxydans]